MVTEDRTTAAHRDHSVYTMTTSQADMGEMFDVTPDEDERRQDLCGGVSEHSASTIKSRSIRQTSSIKDRSATTTKAKAALATSVDPRRSASRHKSCGSDSIRGSVHRRERRSARHKSSSSATSGGPPTKDSLQAMTASVAAMRANDDPSTSTASNQRLSFMRADKSNAATAELGPKETMRTERAPSPSRSSTALLFETKVDLTAVVDSVIGNVAPEKLDSAEKGLPLRKIRRAPSRTKSADDSGSITKSAVRRTLRTKSSGDASIGASNTRRRTVPRARSSAATLTHSSKERDEPKGLLDQHVSSTKRANIVHRRRGLSDDASLCSRDSRQSSTSRHTRIRGSIRRPSSTNSAAPLVVAADAITDQKLPKSIDDKEPETQQQKKVTKTKPKTKTVTRPVLDADGKPVLGEDGKPVMKVVRLVKKPKPSATGPCEKEMMQKTKGSSNGSGSSALEIGVSVLHPSDGPDVVDHVADGDEASILSLEDCELGGNASEHGRGDANDASEVSTEYDFEGEPVPQKKKVHTTSRPPVTASRLKFFATNRSHPSNDAEAGILDRSAMEKASESNLVRSGPQIDNAKETAVAFPQDHGKKVKADNDAVHPSRQPQRIMKRQLSLRSAFQRRQQESTRSLKSSRSMRSITLVTASFAKFTRKMLFRNGGSNSEPQEVEDRERPTVGIKPPSLRDMEP